MLNPHFPYVKIIADFMPAGKLAHAFAVLGRFNILIRHKMIHYQGDFVLMEHAFRGKLIHLMDCHRRRNVISKHQIQVCLN